MIELNAPSQSKYLPTNERAKILAKVYRFILELPDRQINKKETATDEFPGRIAVTSSDDGLGSPFMDPSQPEQNSEEEGES
jgi:hypothetical protein